jgi:hypothetical protein
MKPFNVNRTAVLIVFIFSGLNLAYAQDQQSWFYENEFDVSIPVQEKWTMEVGVGNRGLLQERENGEQVSGYEHQHLELNYFANYNLREASVLSLGLRYRFKELFDDSETNEFRIIEQLELKPLNSALSHRFRLEQRFREEVTHRGRYELGFSTPINDELSFEAATEALYSVTVHFKPEAEQRFSIGLKNSSFKDLDLGLSVEYRMENYARDLAHEFFLGTGVSLSL